MNCRCVIVCLALSTLAGPLWAAPTASLSPSSAQTALDGLIGKKTIIGFTVKGGTRYLGRALSGDHGLYVVERFHYVSAPATVPETTTQTTYVAGRNGRVRPVSKRVTTKVTSQKVIADDLAVNALLSGVAGASARPSEQPAGRELVAPSDVVCLQQLSPPLSGKASWTLSTLWPPHN